jgi:hypothetical protein
MASPASKSHHVVPSPAGGWSVLRGGAERASKHFDQKPEAISWARERSRSQGTELVIHRADGTIQARDSHGKDPFPPRDQP